MSLEIRCTGCFPTAGSSAHARPAVCPETGRIAVPSDVENEVALFDGSGTQLLARLGGHQR